MAVVWNILCGACGEKFKSKTQMPKACPECGESFEDDPADGPIEIKAPFLRSAKTKAIDDVYRQTEKGSEFRMHAAAEVTPGASASDFSGLKITDMKTGVRPGETHAPDISANVARLTTPHAAPGFAGNNAAEYSGAVMSGPAPNAGAHMRSFLSKAHAERGGSVGGQECLEVQQPGYRRRA